MAVSDYERAVKYARSGQAKQMAKPSRPSRVRDHLVKHHGLDAAVGGYPSNELAGLHDRTHSGVFGVAGTNEHRHHHEEVDVGREQTVAMARMNQTFNDRRHAGQRGIYG